MGNPRRYYKQVLQRFAYSLWIESDKNKAEQLADEESVEKLEDEIKTQKEKANILDFMFDAGIIAGSVLECADRDDGCDGLNACIGGLNEFEDLIKEL